MKNIFDWCRFCKHDEWYSGHNLSCRRCRQKDNEKPTHFEEKRSVKAYRKAIESAEYICEEYEVK